MNVDILLNVSQQYAAALDSVNLINAYVDAPPVGMDSVEVADTIRRNVEHLQIMVDKDFWTSEDLEPLHSAIALGG